jgi:hypothetical protein
MSYSEVVDNTYEHYYNVFKLYPITQLLDLCEQNRLSIYGERLVIIDRLALYYSKKNEPSRIYTCIKSIKQLFFNSS